MRSTSIIFSQTCLVMICVVLLQWQQTVSGYTLGDVNSLYLNVTEGYDTRFRPVLNQSNTLNVSVSLGLVSIQDFDEINEILAITAIIHQCWTDELLSWEPKDHSGIEYLTIPSRRVWTPVMSHVNAAKKVNQLGADWQLLNITHKGHVRYVTGNVYTSSCYLNVRYFPWDRQACEIILSVLGHGEGSVTLLSPVDHVITSGHYTDNGLWHLDRSTALTASNGTLFIATLYVDRLPLYIVINIIVPVVFMSFLNVLIFFIPTESGERIAYCITVLLAIAVFMTIVGTYLPKTSNPTSLYSYYLVSYLGISVSITLGTIISLWLYHRDDNDNVSGFWKCLATALGCYGNHGRSKASNTYKETEEIARISTSTGVMCNQHENRSKSAGTTTGRGHAADGAGGQSRQTKIPYRPGNSIERPVLRYGSSWQASMQFENLGLRIPRAFLHRGPPTGNNLRLPRNGGISNDDLDDRHLGNNDLSNSLSNSGVDNIGLRNRGHGNSGIGNSGLSAENTFSYVAGQADTRVSWRTISMAMDKVLFVLFTVLLITNTAIFVWTIRSGENTHGKLLQTKLLARGF